MLKYNIKYTRMYNTFLHNFIFY